VVEVVAAHHVEAAEGVDTQSDGAVQDEILAEKVDAAIGLDQLDYVHGPPEDSGMD